MKKVLPFILVIILVCACALSGCAGRSSGPADLPDGGETAAPAENKGDVRTVGNIKTLVPESWTVIAGGPGGTEDDDSLFLKADESAYEYIWVTVNTQANVASSVKYNSSPEIEPFTINGNLWQGKENAAYATIGDAIFLIMTYGYTAYDDVVQSVMASLAYEG